MASFDKAVLPGGEGKITVKINTKGYRGSHTWRVMVLTNDPQAQKTYLHIKAGIKTAVYLSSHRVYLYAIEGQDAAKSIIVRGEQPEPLTIEPEEFSLDGVATYEIMEMEKGRRYKIRFAVVPGEPKFTRGHLKIKTNYPEKPSMTIIVTVKVVKKTQ